MRPLLLAFQKWFALNKTALHVWALMVELLLMGLILVALCIPLFPDPPLAFLRIWGRRFGYIGLIFYWFTLFPGIFQRLKVFSMAGMLIMTFRRTLGALMFLCAVLHMLLSLVVPFVVLQREFTFTNPRIFGTAAIVLLFPLWLTSNDTSQRFMGKKWKLLQRLTYVALLCIFLHVSYFRILWIIPTGLVLGLEVLSWIAVWWRGRSQATISPADGKIAA